MRPFAQLPAACVALAAVLAAPAFARADEAVPPATAAAVSAAEAPASEQDQAAALAKKLSNPVANLISVPFQNNYNCCYGPAGGGQYLLNIQPVIPISISTNFNLIVRTILPVINQGVTGPGTSNNFGFGDVTQSFFFSPKKPVGGLIVGVGPALVYPLGNEKLGSQKLSAGPTFVVLKQQGPWTAGMLANWVWSFEGPASRAPVNATFLQPFVSYSTKKGASFTLNTESTYNWTGHTWNVPINLMAGQIVKLGSQLVQFTGGMRVYATSPQGGPQWGARLVVTLLFPKK